MQGGFGFHEIVTYLDHYEVYCFLLHWLKRMLYLLAYKQDIELKYNICYKKCSNSYKFRNRSLVNFEFSKRSDKKPWLIWSDGWLKFVELSCVVLPPFHNNSIFSLYTWIKKVI